MVVDDVRERQIRGTALVAKVLTSAIGELARVGYEKLSMEDVAVAAGVNKTTLYRRWTTKRELIQAALPACFMDDLPEPDDHGSLRLDVLHMVKLQRDFVQRPDIRGLIRMACGGPLHEDIAEYAETIRAAKEAQVHLLYTRAIGRGELPADTDVPLLHAIISGAIMELVLFRNELPDDAKLTRVVDLLLRGARATSA